MLQNKRKKTFIPSSTSRNEKPAPSCILTAGNINAFLIQASFNFFNNLDTHIFLCLLKKIKFFMLPKSCEGTQNTRLGKFGSFLRFTLKLSKLTFIHRHLQPIKMQLLRSRTEIRSSKLDARQRVPLTLCSPAPPYPVLKSVTPTTPYSVTKLVSGPFLRLVRKQ